MDLAHLCGQRCVQHFVQGSARNFQLAFIPRFEPCSEHKPCACETGPDGIRKLRVVCFCVCVCFVVGLHRTVLGNLVAHAEIRAVWELRFFWSFRAGVVQQIDTPWDDVAWLQGLGPLGEMVWCYFWAWVIHADTQGRMATPLLLDIQGRTGATAGFSCR